MMIVVMIMGVMMVLVVVMMVVVVMTMFVVVVVMTPLMVGDTVRDDDGGRGALNWGTCKCLPNNFKSPLNLPKYIFFITGSAPVWILC